VGLIIPSPGEEAPEELVEELIEELGELAKPFPEVVVKGSEGVVSAS
jgi:hypothetical protein